MFLKEKREGSIKARGCADSRPQRIYTNKEDASSPTVSIEAMVLSCAIDAKESRYVVMSDILGAFLHADMEDNVHMLLEGTLDEMIVKLPSMYRKLIWYNKKGKLMLYVQLKKALYGTLQAALLFWKLLSETLQEWVFVLNPYDKCVANKVIAVKQCTILWHVDDLKISHVDKNVVDDILKKLNEKFGHKSPLTTSCGKVLDYLGMKIDYRQKGKVKFVMYEYINKILEELPADMSGLATTPASNYLFNTDPGCTKLEEEKGQLFHHLVAKLLYVSVQGRISRLQLHFYVLGFVIQNQMTTKK